jgi:hypothetical protein
MKPTHKKMAELVSWRNARGRMNAEARASEEETNLQIDRAHLVRRCVQNQEPKIAMLDQSGRDFESNSDTGDLDHLLLVTHGAELEFRREKKKCHDLWPAQ